jgi:hypothetical protein
MLKPCHCMILSLMCLVASYVAMHSKTVSPQVPDEIATQIRGGAPTCLTYKLSNTAGCALSGCSATSSFYPVQLNATCNKGDPGYPGNCVFPNNKPFQWYTCFDGFGNSCGSVISSITPCS